MEKAMAPHIYISCLQRAVYCIEKEQEYERASSQVSFIARVMDDTFLLYNSFTMRYCPFFSWRRASLTLSH